MPCMYMYTITDIWTEAGCVFVGCRSGSGAAGADVRRAAHRLRRFRHDLLRSHHVGVRVPHLDVVRLLRPRMW